MKILLTGASGFVGGNLALSLNTSHQVLTSYGKQLPEQRIASTTLVVHLEHGESEFPSAAARLIAEVDCIVHCAALTSPAACERDPSLALRSNVELTKSLVGVASRVARPPIFLLCSTDLLFEGSPPQVGGHTESAHPEPRSVYAQSKFAAEQSLEDYEGPHCAMRLSLVYGPEVNGKQGFLSWINSRLRAGQSCELFSDEWRTPVFSGDISATITALLRIATAGEAIPRVLNLAGSQRLSRFEFGEILCHYFDYDSNLLEPISQKTFTNGPARPADVSLNHETLSQVLDRPPLSVSEGLHRLARQEESAEL